ncbi:MAG: hypothetical protein ETSY2_50505, partial [Candidatus Entotheonella gemina]
MNYLDGLAQVRRQMDRFVVGHNDVKEALMLGLIAREHIYLEGPPGTAKTMLAEITSEAAELEFFFYQLHRDTRLAELVGDTVIFREQEEGGEIIRQMNRKGGILTSQICVLDDISRSPGEALNVLLRVLNERKYGGDPIPLLTAIATGNPTKEDYYNEPLDPANLDRFTLQMKTLGLVGRNHWEDAAQVIDLYASTSSNVREVDEKVDRAALDAANTAMPKVDLTPAVKQLVLEFLNVLINDYGCDDKNSMLTDRTFLVKAVKILKSKAVLEGRDHCVPEDMFVMKYLTTFRIPEELHDRIEDIIAELLRKKKIVPDESEEIEQMSQAQSEEQSEGEPRTDYSAQEAAVDHRKQQMELGEMIQQTLSPNAEDGGDNSEMNLDQE